MVRRFAGLQQVAMLAILVAAFAVPAAAQSGVVKGVVADTKGQPVEGAKVTIEMTGGTGRRFETKTNKKGEYVQIGLSPGSYKITAEKDALVSQPANVPVRSGRPSDVNLVVGAAGGAAGARAAELKKLFDEGVALSTAGNHAGAIEKFNAAAAISPTCYDCHNNVGFSYFQLKDYDNAEAAYKKSVEVKADDAAGYQGLANVYNAQRKFDLAAEATGKAQQYSATLPAGQGGGADASFNQGVILWNAGKIADAKKAFEAAVQADPNHAEAHYQLGMALVNEGNLAGAATEFETYLKLAPAGPNAATAKSLVAQLKK